MRGDFIGYSKFSSANIYWEGRDIYGGAVDKVCTDSKYQLDSYQKILSGCLLGFMCGFLLNKIKKNRIEDQIKL